MKFTQIIFDVTDKIATITLNRPEARNALAPQMRVELAEAMDHIKKKAGEDIKAVILTGAGGAFCAGGDVKSMGSRLNSASKARAALRDDHQKMFDLMNLELPVISLIDGAAAGAGANIALAADFVRPGADALRPAVSATHNKRPRGLVAATSPRVMDRRQYLGGRDGWNFYRGYYAAGPALSRCRTGFCKCRLFGVVWCRRPAGALPNRRRDDDNRAGGLPSVTTWGSGALRRVCDLSAARSRRALRPRRLDSPAEN